MKTTVALIIPMFAIYTTAIVSLFVLPAKPSLEPAPPVQFRTVFVTVFFPVIFVVAIVAMILLKAYKIGFSTFEEFKDMLGIIETVFAVYLATVLRALFDIKSDPN